jgi:hypothetical protein
MVPRGGNASGRPKPQFPATFGWADAVILEKILENSKVPRVGIQPPSAGLPNSGMMVSIEPRFEDPPMRYIIIKRRGSYAETLPGEPSFDDADSAFVRADEILRAKPEIIQRGLESLGVRGVHL